MAEIEYDIEGLDKFFRKMSRVTKSKVLNKALDQGAIKMIYWIKKNRLTGPRPKYLGVASNRLRSSISKGRVFKRGKTLSVSIGTNVKGKNGYDYPRAHEFGLGRKARPFLKPSTEDRALKNDIENNFAELIQDELEKK